MFSETMRSVIIRVIVNINEFIIGIILSLDRVKHFEELIPQISAHKD